MIRCKRCGAENYAIDMWCSNCSQHLDWAPAATAAAAAAPLPEAVAAPVPEAVPAPVPEAVAAPVPEAVPAPVPEAVPALVPEAVPAPVPEAVAAPEPEAVAAPEPQAEAAPPPVPVGAAAVGGATERPRRRRPVPVWILPIAAAGVVAVLLALPVAGWFKAGSHPQAATQLPLTAGVSPSTPVASPTPPATPIVTPSPEPSVAPSEAAPVPPVAQPLNQQPVPVPAYQATAGDPAGTVAGFYQAVAAHQFGAAAATWSARMQASYPPGEFINRRFAYTEQMSLRQARTLSSNGQIAAVYIDLIEVYAGSTRHWVGTWQLVGTSSGWLLNQPNLRAAG